MYAIVSKWPYIYSYFISAFCISFCILCTDVETRNNNLFVGGSSCNAAICDSLAWHNFGNCTSVNARKGGDRSIVQWFCRVGVAKHRKADLITFMAWHGDMSLAHGESKPAANFLLLWSGRTSGNHCSWHKLCAIVVLPIRWTKKRIVQLCKLLWIWLGEV